MGIGTSKVLCSTSQAISIISSKYCIDECLCHNDHKLIHKVKDLENDRYYFIRTMFLHVCDENILLHEYHILERLSHTNITKVSDFFGNLEFQSIVTPFYEGITLKQLFNQRMTSRHIFAEHEGLSLISPIIKAVSYCHLHNIAHRNISLENIIFKYNVCNPNELKLIGFKNAVEVSPDTIMHDTIGSIIYQSPQMIQESYTMLSDEFSIGVILYVLLCSHVPFVGEQSILQGEYDTMSLMHFSDDTKELVTGLLQHEEAKRLSVNCIPDQLCQQYQNLNTTRVVYSTPRELLSVDTDIASDTNDNTEDSQVSQFFYCDEDMPTPNCDKLMSLIS